MWDNILVNHPHFEQEIEVVKKLLSEDEIPLEEQDLNQKQVPCSTTPSKTMSLSGKRRIMLNSMGPSTNIDQQDPRKTKIIEFVDNFFCSYLFSYKTLPLHEVCYFNDQNVLETFSAPIRKEIGRHLENPQSFLKCHCCPRNDIISSSLPDTSILYKLSLECGRYINLYDWYVSFCGIIADGKDSTSNLSRFIQAVKELHFLGLIEYAKNPTEHVIRVVHQLS